MANKLYEETSIRNIADAIKEKTGKNINMTVEQMATEIKNIESGGYNNEIARLYTKGEYTPLYTGGLGEAGNYTPLYFGSEGISGFYQIIES